MSAATLRRAASLMRARADAAIEDSDGAGVWRVGPAEAYGHTPTVVVDLPDGEGPYELAAGCADADAEHIASWHPTVALAVANWLDAASTFADAQIDYHALAVANAYLATSPPSG